MTIVDTIEFMTPKTQDFTKMLKNFNVQDKKTLLILSDVNKEQNTFMSARNIDSVLPLFHTDVLLDDILNADAVVMTAETAKLIEGRLN